MKVTTPRHLPDGWSVATIGDVAEVNPRLNKTDIPDNLPVSFVPMPAVGAGDGAIDINQERLFSEVKKGFTSFQEGDVLFAKITPCMENGKMAVIPNVKNGYGFGSTEFHVLRPKESMDARYLYYYISNKSFRNEAAGHMAGAVGQKRVPTAYLKECKIPVAPLPEQKRIVAEIEKQFSRLDEAVANLKRIKANLKRYKAAVLKAAVEGKLTEQWRKEHPDVEPADTILEHIAVARDQWIEKQVKNGNGEAKTLRTKLKKHQFKPPADVELPNHWAWASFLTASQMVVDCHNKTATYEADGIPLIRTTNIRDSKLNLEDVKYVSAETYAYWSRRCPPQPGDILFTREAPMGEAAIIPKGAKVCMGQRIMLLRVFNDLISTKYLLYSIMSPTFQGRLGSGAVGTGVKHLRVGDVEALPIAVPPLEEQNQIVGFVDSKLSVVVEIEAEVSRNLKRAERLRQSILDFAFSGDLVQQNADAESGAWPDMPLVAEAKSIYKSER